MRIFAQMDVQIAQLLGQSAHLLDHVPTGFRRFLHQDIRWTNRLIGVKGARGTGKTTLLLQWLKDQNLPPDKGAYFSLDDLYFTTFQLKDAVHEFYRSGGKILVLDEVHKYQNWAQEIKNCHDFYPGLKIIFTGSSIMELSQMTGDLSRRALMYNLPGLSFREYLLMKGIADFPRIDLHDLISNPHHVKECIPSEFQPHPHFRNYLQRGTYPYLLEDEEAVHHRIKQLVRTIVEVDMAEIQGLDIRNARKLLQLIYIIAQQVPFKPNLSSLSERTNIHRNSLNPYLHYLEQAQLLRLIHPAGISVATLQKPEKIYLQNTTLLNALASSNVNAGTIRETFFLDQLTVHHLVNIPKHGDFIVDETYTFEIGGKRKNKTQIKDIPQSYIVRDDQDIPIGNSLPLWYFGLLY
ncbi:MAG: ATP-binding protein [Saprospiraceae bacterium]